MPGAAHSAARHARHGTAPTAEWQPCGQECCPGHWTTFTPATRGSTMQSSNAMIVHARMHANRRVELSLHLTDLQAPCTGGNRSGTIRQAARLRLIHVSKGSPDAAAIVASFIAAGPEVARCDPCICRSALDLRRHTFTQLHCSSIACPLHHSGSYGSYRDVALPQQRSRLKSSRHVCIKLETYSQTEEPV